MNPPIVMVFLQVWKYKKTFLVLGSEISFEPYTDTVIKICS